MSEIFISYAHEDHSVAQALAGGLQAIGYSVFWDSHIRAGQEFRHMIYKELNKAQCVVVLWSAHSLESEWVFDEAEIAKKRGVLLPVLLEGIDPPLGYRHIHAQRLSLKGGPEAAGDLDRLVAAIAETAKSPPLAPGSLLPGVAAASRRGIDALLAIAYASPVSVISLVRGITFEFPLIDEQHSELVPLFQQPGLLLVVAGMLAGASSLAAWAAWKGRPWGLPAAGAFSLIVVICWIWALLCMPNPGPLDWLLAAVVVLPLPLRLLVGPR